MTAQGLIGAARTFHERGSLDLMLASPLPVRRMLAAARAGDRRKLARLDRDPGAARRQRGRRARRARLAAGLSGAGWTRAHRHRSRACRSQSWLFEAFTPRRARLIAQLSAAIGRRRLPACRAGRGPAAGCDAHGRSRGDLAVPSRKARHLDLAGLARRHRCRPCSLPLSCALSEPFRRASLRAAGTPADVDADGTSRHRASQFGAGVGRTLRRKEWRLLTRDPNLFSQLSLQIIYTVPLAVVLCAGPREHPARRCSRPRRGRDRGADRRLSDMDRGVG